MELALIAFGGLLMLGGILFVVIHAFAEGVLWGLAVIFVPFAFLAFVVLHWGTVRKPALTIVAGLALGMLASAMAPKEAEEEEAQEAVEAARLLHAPAAIA